MFRLWSEWDFGEGDKVFATKEAGMRWLQSNPDVATSALEDRQTVEAYIEQCFDDGYFDWQRVEVIE